MVAQLRNGSGSKIGGSFKPFEVKEITELKERIIRSNSVPIPHDVSTLRDVCKKANAARWKLAVEDIEKVNNIRADCITDEIKDEIIDYLQEKNVEFTGTVECILDYYRGAQKIKVSIDRKTITYNSAYDSKIATKAANDCLKLDEQCVQKIKQKIDNCKWPEYQRNEQQHLSLQYSTLSKGISFVNHFMKAFYSGAVNDISKEVFQKACSIDPQTQNYYHIKRDNPNIFKSKTKKLYRSIPNKKVVVYLICEAFSF